MDDHSDNGVNRNRTSTPSSLTTPSAAAASQPTVLPPEATSSGVSNSGGENVNKTVKFSENVETPSAKPQSFSSVHVPNYRTQGAQYDEDNPLQERAYNDPPESRMFQNSFDSSNSYLGRVVSSGDYNEDQYKPVKPNKARSVLITNNSGYKSVADFEEVPTINENYLNPEGDAESMSPTASGGGSFLLPVNEQRDVDQNSALHAYEFIVGAETPLSTSESEEENSAPYGDSREPFPPPSRETSGTQAESNLLEAESAAELVQKLSRSFAQHRSFGKNSNFDHSPFGMDPYQEPSAYNPGEEYYFELEMPEARFCTSSSNLDDDSLSLTAVLQSGKSDALLKSVFYGARITLFCVFPSFLLTEHPKTASWFVSGALLPVMGSLSVREPCSLGMQCVMTICGIQGVILLMVWGVITNAIGTKYNTSGWWCAIIAGCFGTSLLGDLLAKRLMMMFVVIVMQMQHTPGGDTLIFPLKLGRDMAIAFGFALVAVLLPWPTLCKNMARDAMIGIHKLHAAALGNIVKSFWAPVPVDAKIAFHQVPFVRIREVQAKMKKLLMLCRYEPSEFNLNNIHRGERLALLDEIKVDLYCMAAASSERLEDTKHFAEITARKEVKETHDMMQKASGLLAKEVITIFMNLGMYMAPTDVLKHINFGPMCERAQILSDLVDQKRAEMFFVQRLTKDETNYYLRMFSFCNGLINIASKLRKLEDQCIHFDKSKYPSLARRAFDFFFYEIWRDFWAELPKRMTWATARDVRMWKDGIKYSLGFAVACAFTLNYDKDNVYFFGMAILVRLAQQTASETLFIGVQRICGLAIGASLAVITHGKTHNLAERTLLTLTWEFIAFCLANHPQFGQMAQYVAVISITGLTLAAKPSVLLTRITDNVFAFISYFLICVVIFPVDPVRVLWNTRTKLFMSLNRSIQNFVTLVCAPVTKSGEEVQFLIKENKAELQQIFGLVNAYDDWMKKSAGEPLIRGGEYPAKAVNKILVTFSEILALHEALQGAVVLLHRPRPTWEQTLVHDMMELLRPFVLDVGKLYHAYFQELINSTEFPVGWSMEASVRILWKARLACRMLRHVTGNIQRNFYAALQQVSGNERKGLNSYLNSSFVEGALAEGVLPPQLISNPANEEMLERLFAMSFHMSDKNFLVKEDLHAFNAIVSVFQLELQTMGDLILPMLEIHEFEKSRVI